MVANVVPHAIDKAHIPINVEVKDGGSSKLGATPGGGVSAGVLEKSVLGNDGDDILPQGVKRRPEFEGTMLSDLYRTTKPHNPRL